ncbi:metal-dependent hydrolase [Deinococcus cellulosilyticus]|uniref:UPF0173 metal-dependent hydrolase DC3_50180 n=1 Tax=Deinococcus cellulosilyticus (strain DSM 18568 / NBRC 106333 / KACC 11606 / 5516J-15) TaxID=1223518 RepID=A0A511N951_DEIC1|nr:metal-dependent hydrolase [Deinococcus cellulosilyticus]GEM49383.1 UPF0173 metal-dependent hydrolase [Deinococcus cellulosilyticus NBRC 106333 = KACC 11606]
MRIEYLGHSCLYIETGDFRLLIDPFVQGNPLCPVSLEELKGRNITHVLVTHAHGDHWGNTLDFAREGAQVIGIVEITSYAAHHGARSTHGMNIGGSHPFDWGTLQLTPAWHSSSFPDGTYGGFPTGMVLTLEGKKIYHAGDTCRFREMEWIGDLGLDLAFLPIGDNFTMNADEAAKCLPMLRPRLTVPMHYNTFPVVNADPARFETEAEMLGFQVQIMSPGATLEL